MSSDDSAVQEKQGIFFMDCPSAHGILAGMDKPELLQKPRAFIDPDEWNSEIVCSRCNAIYRVWAKHFSRIDNLALIECLSCGYCIKIRSQDLPFEVWDWIKRKELNFCLLMIGAAMLLGLAGYILIRLGIM